MKNILNFKNIGILVMLFTFASCEDFLNRPVEDNYSIDGFYKTDAQCREAANTLYASPWNDYLRGFLMIGDALAGNYHLGPDNIYQNHSVGSDEGDLIGASNALWLVIGHSNTAIENIRDKSGPNVTEWAKNTYTGEAMVMKSMAYFYLVRAWGAIPIIHYNSTIIGSGTAFDLKKNKVADVYKYIILTLEKAAELLPESNESGRIDKYSAYGLLAKVYLTASGVGQSGSRDQEMLDKAKYYAGLVVDNSGRSLEPIYGNLFRISTGNYNKECLITLHWYALSNYWTCRNWMQPDLVSANFSGTASGWGQYRGATVDLQNLFGEDARSTSRQDKDVRRKATMMMYSDVYPYWWREIEGGFKATWNNTNVYANSQFECGSGAMCVKHIHGNNKDHNAEAGYPSDGMCSSTATHLLRLADVYLVYVEAVMGNTGSTSDAKAIEVYNRVLTRAGLNTVSSVTFDELFNQRRKELAFEGDNWYDYVRLSYYNPSLAESKILAQERGQYDLTALKAVYAGTGVAADVKFTSYKVTSIIKNTSGEKFCIPFPQTDLSSNGHLLEDPVDYDFGQVEYAK
jgi:starch-binding outer membrane protein, SusD/RagB family